MARHGDVVIVSLPGDYGKPRPALVVQSDRYALLPSVVVCPITTSLRTDLSELRLTLQPTPENGLQQPCQVMLDKPGALPRAKLSAPIGRLGSDEMLHVRRVMTDLFDIG
jgi:mRNA interferase MazF